MSDSIKVAIKVRPLIKRERDDNLPVQWNVQEQTIFSIDPETKRRGEHSHVFDHIFDMDANNAHVFDVVVKPIVDATVNGFNGTIFAYGQTSSGKTYTMMGTEKEPGIIPLAVENIFDAIANTSTREFLLRVSYLEIYNEKVNDLLHKDGTDLKIHEDPNGQVIVNCKEEVTNCPQNVLSIMKKGEKNRRIGETNMNDKSSRSHTIFRITIESRDAASTSEGAIQVSQLNLVDLAGSERVRQTGATGDRFKEGRHINLSLTSLSLVIMQLSEAKEYVNFRDSKLTRILQASLGGNAMTTIICAVTPAALEETQCTLSFAARAKRIKNKPKLNEVVSEAALLKRFAKLIDKLSTELAQERQANRCGEVKEMESKLQEKDEYIQLIEDRMQLLKTKIVSSANSVENVDFKTKSRRRRTWCGPSNSNFLNHSMMLPTIQELPSTENTMPDWKAAHFTKNLTITQAPLTNITEKFHTEMEDFELELIESERNWEMGRFSSDSEDLEDNYYITKRNHGRGHVKFLDDVLVYPDIDNESVAGSPAKSEVSTPPRRREEEEEDTGTPKEVLRNTLTNLANEYKTLLEFTTLEKQIYTTATVETVGPAQSEIKYSELESKYNAALQENEIIKKRLESLCKIEESYKLIELEKNQLKMDMEEKLGRLKKLEEERTDYECQIELLKSKHKMREKELETSLQIAWRDSANIPDNQKSSTGHLQSLVDNLMKEVKALKEKPETIEISSATQVLSTENKCLRKTVEEYDMLIETERTEKRKLIEELKELKKSLDRQLLINRRTSLTRNDKSLSPCEQPSSTNDDNFNTSESSEKVICENLGDSVCVDAVQLNLSDIENEKLFEEIAPLELRRKSQSLNGILDDVQSKIGNSFVGERDFPHEIQNEKAYDEKLNSKNVCTEPMTMGIDNGFGNSKFSAVSEEPSDYTKDLLNTSTQTAVEVQSDLIIDTKILDIDLLKLEVEKLLSEKESFIKENDMLKLQTETLIEEIKALKLATEKIEKDHEDLENMTSFCKKELTERDSKLQELQNNIHKLENQVISMQSERTLYEGQKCDMEKIMNENLTKIQNLELTSAEFERMNLELRTNLNEKCMELESIEMHKYENEIQNLKSYIENLEQFIKKIQTENEDLKNQLHNQSQNLEDNIDDIRNRLIQQEKITDTLEKDKNTLTQRIGQLSQEKSESIVTTKSDSVDKPKCSNEKCFEDTKDYSSIFTNASYFDEMDVSLTEDTTLLNESTGNVSYFEDDKTSCNATMLESRISESEDSNRNLEVAKTELSNTLTGGEDNLSNNDIVNKLHEATKANMLLQDKNEKIAMELQLKIQESDEIKNDVQGLRLGIEKLEQTIHLLTTENMEMSSKLTIEKDCAKEVEAKYQEQIEDLHRRISKIDEDKMNVENQLKIAQENLVNLQDTSLSDIDREAREKIVMYQEKIDLLTMENIELSTNLMDRIDELDKLKEDQALLNNHKCSDVDTVEELRVQLESITQKNTELSKILMEKIEESDSLKHVYELLEKNLATPVNDLVHKLKHENDLCFKSNEAESDACSATSLQIKEQSEAASQAVNYGESQINIEDLKLSLKMLREENISLLDKIEALQQESIALKSELLTNGNRLKEELTNSSRLKEELDIAKQFLTKEQFEAASQTENCEESQNNIEDLKFSLAKLREENISLLDKVESLQQESIALKSELLTNGDRVKEELTNSNRLKEELDIAKQCITKQQFEATSQTENCEESQSNIEDLKFSLAELREENLALLNKIESLQQESIALKSELLTNGDRVKEELTNSNRLKEELDIAKQCITKEQFEAASQVENCEESQSNIEDLKFSLAELREGNIALLNKVESLQQESIALKSELLTNGDRLKEELTNSNRLKEELDMAKQCITKEQFEAASQTENCEESQSNIEDLKLSLAKLRDENISLLNKVESLQQESIALEAELLANSNEPKEELKVAKQCITKEIGFLKPELKISTLLTKTVGELLGDFIKIIMTKEQEIITKVKEDFKQEKQNLEDQKSQSADAVRRTTIWANELEADIEKLQTEIAQQENVNVTLKCEIDRLENDLKESNHEKQLLKEKIEVLENDFVSLQTEFSKQSNSNNKQDEEVNAIQERERIALAAAKHREMELQNSMKSMKNELNKKIEESTYALEQQKTKNIELKSNLEGLQATESQLKSIIDLKSTELMKLQQRVVTLEMENAQMIVVRNQLNEENENKTKRIEEITSILKIKCDEMSEYKTKLESIVPEYEIYKEQMKERKQYAHENELLKEKFKKELNVLNDKLSDEKIKNRNLLSQLNDLNDKNKLLISEIEEQKQRCEELERTNEKLNKKVRNSTSNFKVEAQLEDLKDQNEMLRNNAEGASNRITELLEVKNSITKDFATLQEKYKILLEENRELVASNNTKVSSSDVQLSEIRNQLEDQIREKNKISFELEATKVILSQKDKDLTIAQQEIERLSLTNKELDQEAEELAQEIQQRNTEAEKLRNDLFEAQNNSKSISNNVIGKTEVNEDGRNRKSFQDMAEVEVLIQQNKELRKELETLNITTDFLRKGNAELKARVAELESRSCDNSKSRLLEVANSSSCNALPTSQLSSLAKKVRELELEIVSKNGKIATLELQIQSENFPYQKKCRDLEENLSAFKHKNMILKEEVKNLHKTMGSASAAECEACRKRQTNRRDQSTQCLPEQKTYLSGISSGFVDEYAKVMKLEKENKLMRDLCRSRTREIKKLEKEVSKQELIISEKSMVELSLQKKLSEYEMILSEKSRMQTTSRIEESKSNSPDKNIRSLKDRSKSPLEENVKRALKENLSFNILDDASAVKTNHISSIWTHYP